MLRYRSRIRCDGPNARRGGGGGGSALFSPATLFASSEPGAWYEVGDISTLFQDTAATVPVTAVGQSVLRINDKTSNGFHATQSVVGQAPTYQIDSSGKPYLIFDGANSGMATSTITPGIDKVQVFAGIRKLSDATPGIVCEFSADSSVNNGSFRVVSPVTSLGPNYGFVSAGTLPAAVSAVGIAAPSTNTLTGIGDIFNDVSTFRVNGVQAATSSTDQGTGNYLAYPLYLGRRGGTTLPFNGRLYSLIVRFGANLSADQIASTENWVNARTGAY